MSMTLSAFVAPPTPVGDSMAGARTGQDRIVALDGLRGLLTIMVVVSHYFGEIPHGIPGATFGWMAVLVFFALSGFLVGGQILDHGHRAGFIRVFFIRRLCRIVPAYLGLVLVVFALMALLGRPSYMEITADIPLWAYLTFTQNWLMARADALGPYWLTPTWSLSIEEQFYLIAPFALVLVPRHRLPYALAAAAACAVAFRALVMWSAGWPKMAALIYLPACLDVFAAGLLAAHLRSAPWLARFDFHLRVVPLLALVGIIGLKVIDGKTGHLFDVFGRFFIAVGACAYLLAIVRGAPEAQSLLNPWLRFMGRISYATYLTHVMVIGLVHGLVLGTPPDIGNFVQFAATVAALPLAMIVGWAITKFVEEPITAWGRRFTWQTVQTSRRNVGGPAPTPA